MGPEGKEMCGGVVMKVYNTTLFLWVHNLKV